MPSYTLKENQKTSGGIKLLYATSMGLPSKHANRRQIVSMARAFHTLLGDGFLLGMAVNREGAALGVPVVEMGEGIRSFFLAWKYLRLIRARGITHVYMREDRLFFFLHLYIKLLRMRTPIFFEAHALTPGFFCTYALSHADGVVALTRGLQEDSNALRTSLRILIAPDGVDLKRFTMEMPKAEARRQFGIPQDVPVAAYIGRYDTMHQEDKGVADFIRALGRARATLPFHLLIVGLSGVEESIVGRFSEACGIGESARTLVPYVSQEDVASAMRAADILIMNYPNVPHFARHMSPMKLFEYMASHTPTITTDLPSVREILSDEEAFFVPTGDTNALSNMLVFVAQNKEEGDRKSATAFEKVKGYTWDIRAKSIIDFITQV